MEPYMNKETMMVALGAGWAVSEALALIPGVRSNSVFQLVHGIIGKMLGKTVQ